MLFLDDGERKGCRRNFGAVDSLPSLIGIMISSSHLEGSQGLRGAGSDALLLNNDKLTLIGQP